MNACCSSCASGGPCTPQARVAPVALRMDGATPLAAPAITGEGVAQGAIGPELAQAVKLRRSWQAAAIGLPNANSLRGQGRGRNTTVADIALPPQVFPAHPAIVEASMREAIAGADVGWPGVPGRLPPASWDGEPGVTNPNRDAF